MSAGDDGTGLAPADGGGGEAKTTDTGAATVSGECVAARRAGQHAAETAGIGATGRAARGRQETPRVHGLSAAIRPGSHSE